MRFLRKSVRHTKTRCLYLQLRLSRYWKNPVANTVSASLPGTVTGELLVADSINVLDTFSDLGDKIRYLASCYKSDLTMRHSSCQENFKKILGSLSFIKFFPELKELSEDDYQYFLSFVDDIFTPTGYYNFIEPLRFRSNMKKFLICMVAPKAIKVLQNSRICLLLTFLILAQDSSHLAFHQLIFLFNTK